MATLHPDKCRLCLIVHLDILESISKGIDWFIELKQTCLLGKILFIKESCWWSDDSFHFLLENINTPVLSLSASVHCLFYTFIFPIAEVQESVLKKLLSAFI